MNPPRRSADYTLYKRHGIWPIAHASGWSAEIINPDGVLVHTTATRLAKAEVIAEAKRWLDENVQGRG